MENGTFAPQEQMFHFPLYLQIHDTSKASKCVIMGKGLTMNTKIQTSGVRTHFVFNFPDFVKGSAFIFILNK